MEFRKWDIDFDGCYCDPSELRDAPGVWVVWRRYGLIWSVVDMGDAADVRDAASSFTPPPGSQKRPGVLMFAAVYTGDDPTQRRAMLEHIHRNALPLLVS